jgi:hypothetical protein
MNSGLESVLVSKTYYVYELFDRSTGETFYVGEGVRDRALHHKKESERIRNKLMDDPSLGGEILSDKVGRICALMEAGEDGLGIRVVGRFDSKEEALAVETVLINWVYGIDCLTNVSRGHGNQYVRPRSRANEELVGLDIGRSIRVFGARRKSTGYLKERIRNHEAYGHISMAEDIAGYLRKNLPGVSVDDPCFWEGGVYVAVFVELVPDTVRMIIQLTSSDRNRHSYNLKPMTERADDKNRFVSYLEKCKSDGFIPYDDKVKSEDWIPDGGSYAWLPEWKRGKLTSNIDQQAILRQVQYAISTFQAAIKSEISV